VPEVGLEVTFSPCKHWEPAETGESGQVRPIYDPIRSESVSTVDTAFPTDFERLQATAVASVSGARQFSVVPNALSVSAASLRSAVPRSDVSALCQVE
jgi:hypothetical protein